MAPGMLRRAFHSCEEEKKNVDKMARVV